jgi:hypothetical protein
LTLKVTLADWAGKRLPANVHLIAPVALTAGEVMAQLVRVLGNVAGHAADTKVVYAGVAS